MISVYLQGLSLSAGLIIAIGAQNAFIIRQGLKREHRFLVALISAILDALLILLGILGFGSIVLLYPSFVEVFTWLGIVYLFIFGALAFRSSFFTAPKHFQIEQKATTSIKKILLLSLSFSLLNPHCYLDTVVLIGSVSSNYAGPEKVFFGAGAMTASFVWFFSAVYAASFLAPLFKKPMTWKALDFAIGVIMWSIAASFLFDRIN